MTTTSPFKNRAPGVTSHWTTVACKGERTEEFCMAPFCGKGCTLPGQARDIAPWRARRIANAQGLLVGERLVAFRLKAAG